MMYVCTPKDLSWRRGWNNANFFVLKNGHTNEELGKMQVEKHMWSQYNISVAFGM